MCTILHTVYTATLGNQVECIHVNHSPNQLLSTDIKFVFQFKAAKDNFLKGRMVVFYFEEGQNRDQDESKNNFVNYLLCHFQVHKKKSVACLILGYSVFTVYYLLAEINGLISLILSKCIPSTLGVLLIRNATDLTQT